MPWRKAIHKPTEVWAETWDGTARHLYQLFTPEQFKQFGIRFHNPGDAPYAVIKTEVAGVPVRPGDILILKYHPRLGRDELYVNRPQIFPEDYIETEEIREAVA